MKVLAVDIGGSHVECALVSDRTIIRAERVCLPPGSTFRQLLAGIHDPLSRLRAVPEGYSCAGIVLSFCGQVDARARRIVATNGKYDDGCDVDLEEWARSCFQLPLEIENDAR